SDNDLHDQKYKIQVENSKTILTNEINQESVSYIELEKRKIALLEYQAKLRKELAKAETIKLQNQQLKINLGLPL
ncbi:9869_t:CDS:1, partial [Dentiscutata heterogama]